jgi:two-component system, chemotaxis family, sensor kinase Cph1
MKSIVNHDVVNLENCDQEPIHIPGSIQPHGFLLGLDKTTYAIEFCSENISELCDLDIRSVLGKSFADIFGFEALENLRNSMKSVSERKSTFTLSINNAQFEFLPHQSNQHIIVDAEVVSGEIGDTEFLELSREFVGYIEETSTLKELCASIADGTRKITGYDRVMIYRFDEHYNGEVIAESKEDGYESFFGLHYPHTDIPKQARELYIRNQLRLIVDIGYVPVPILTLNNELDSSSLDLSLSTLRSVSPIHVQYLQNMGVGATMTISLLHKRKLWGLIACHHYSPKFLTNDVRMAAKLLGHFITSQIDMRQMNEEHEISRRANHAVEWLNSRKFELNRNSLEMLVNDYHILTVCNASSVAILLDGRIYKSDKAPGDEDIRTVTGYLSMYTANGKTHTDSILTLMPDMKTLAANQPGVNYISLDNYSQNCIIWFRQETINEVHWAGNPNKAIEKDKNGLSPRKSFELWRETVKNKSNPWLATELSACSNFTNILSKHLSAVFLTEEEEKQRTLAEILKQTNAELENINWISTHDLQEPLRKIQMMASYILQEDDLELPEKIHERIDKMSQFANRMQVLIKDILRYTQLNYSDETFETVNLNEVFVKLGHDLEEALLEKHAKLTVGKLPSVRGVPFLVRQLFSNLIYNSLKFASVNREPEIRITASQGEYMNDGKQYDIIEVADNGIGFDASFNQKVFKIFTRLENSTEKTGSGIGLALCKKIMETHKGHITADGELDKGASFRIYFAKRD